MPALAAATSALGALGVGYAAGVERVRWTLRHTWTPLLSPESAPLRVLHLSDLHMMPGQRSKQRWIRDLDDLEPDLVALTGDNLAHRDAVPATLNALGPLLDRPGLFVFGSNDYYGPIAKNPARYLHRSRGHLPGTPLPWRDLRDGLSAAGWLDLTNTRTRLDVGGRRLEVSGVDDPHIHRDRYAAVAGPVGPAELHIGLSHSPEPRVLDRFTADGFELLLCGHTHGGQLRIPGYGALVTNCGIDRRQCRGLSAYAPGTWLNVSAGLGTSPYAPVRFACPPEVSLLDMLPRARFDR